MLDHTAHSYEWWHNSKSADIELSKLLNVPFHSAYFGKTFVPNYNFEIDKDIVKFDIVAHTNTH